MKPDVIFIPTFLNRTEADALFERIRSEADFRRNFIQLYGRKAMQDHYEEKAADYEASVTKGFTTLRPGSYSIPVGEEPRNFRTPVEEKLMIRGMLIWRILEVPVPGPEIPFRHGAPFCPDP